MHQNALRYQGIRLYCDVADVNNTVNSSQERWQHDLWMYQVRRCIKLEGDLNGIVC